MNEIASQMEREYEKAMDAERAGDMIARRSYLEKAFELRDRFLEDFLAEEPAAAN